MNQAAKIVITGYVGVRLTISLDSFSSHQECKVTDKAIRFYKSLIYQLNKEDELDKSFYEEDSLDITFEDGADSEALEELVEDEEEEGYFFSDHQFK